MTIYVDVLIILNLYVTYFLIKATGRITHTKLVTWRILLSSFIGSLFSLIIFIPNLNTLGNTSIKLAAAVLVVKLAFGKSDLKIFFKMTLYFFGMNFVFAGVMLFVYFTFKPNFMSQNNGVFYLDFSIITLGICTVIAYAAVCIVRYIIDKSAHGGKYRIVIRCGDKIASLEGIADTGNMLLDSFSGKPVIVCGAQSISSITGGTLNIHNIYENRGEGIKNVKGFRLLPFSTVGNAGIIPVFSADEIVIKAESGGVIKKADALIGVGTNEGAAVFNPKLLE